MAQSVNSLKVKSGTGRSTRDQSFDHVTTIDFNVVKPLGCFEMVPGDHINIRPEVWLRTQPMNVPTFGKMDVITRAFFVPLRLCWTHYNDFYRQAPTGVSGLISQFSSVPKAFMSDLSKEFTRRFDLLDSIDDFISYDRQITNMEGQARRLHFGAEVSATSYVQASAADFTIRVGASLLLYKFNPIGKRIYDFFNSLGYRWQFFIPNDTTSSNKGTEDNYYYVSILPLLGWLRLFTDWYCPSEFKYLFSDVVYSTDSTTFDRDDIKRLFDQLTWAVFIYFNDDIFSMCENLPYKKGNAVKTDNLNLTQITAEPNSLLSRVLEWHKNTIVPDHGLGSRTNDFSAETNGQYGELYLNSRNVASSRNDQSGGALNSLYIKSSGTGTSIADFATPINNLISHWTVNGVMRAAQWLQRNNLLSSRLTEYLNAKFGVTPTAARLDQAEYIGHAGSPVKISDIAGTTDENLAQLGAKGTSYNIDKFGYTAEEFGYLYFTVELRPRIGYGQGVDPLVLRTRLDEFYNQEFDSLGFEPVPTECLVSGPLTYHSRPDEETMNNGSTDNRIFGYLPRGWSYKCKHDMLSGDFMTPQQAFDGDLQSYHLMRTVSGFHLEDFIHNSLSFRYAGLSVNENRFARIFKNMDSSVYDHFQLIVSFDAETSGLPLALNESWQVNADHDEREGHLTNIQASL